MLDISVRIVSFTPREIGVCAEVSVVLCNVLCINNIKVVSGAGGVFVAMPSSGCSVVAGKKLYKDIVHPTSQEFKKRLDDTILDCYNTYVEEHK